jgi:hypothetical protein
LLQWDRIDVLTPDITLAALIQLIEDDYGTSLFPSIFLLTFSFSCPSSFYLSPSPSSSFPSTSISSFTSCTFSPTSPPSLSFIHSIARMTKSDPALQIDYAPLK